MVTDCHSRGFLFFFSTQPLRPSVHVRQLLKLHTRPLIHSIYIPPFPSSIPTSNVFRLVVRFFSHCMCSCVYLYATGSRRDDIRVQFQQQQLHTFRRPSTVAHHLAAKRIRRLVSFATRRKLFSAWFHPHMGGTPPEKKKQVMPSETSHPISFVMKRLVELTMTNGRRLVRLFF